MTNWHRLFGLVLNDFFTGTPYQVELEKDLTLQQQFLDVVIIHQDVAVPFDMTTLPDGLDNLKKHNLLTYKSIQESLNAFAIDELIGHAVNYQKLLDQRFNADEMQLYAVTTRHPEKLFKTVKPQTTPQQGIYDLAWGAQIIRVVVLNQIENHPRNAPWHLFSSKQDKIRYGLNHYNWKRAPATVMQQLYWHYKLEEWIEMAYTYEQFEQEFKQEFLQRCTAEELLNQLSTEERLRGLPAEERLRGLPTEERLRGLPTEERLRGLSAEERLQGLSEKQLEKLFLSLQTKVKKD